MLRWRMGDEMGKVGEVYDSVMWIEMRDSFADGVQMDIHIARTISRKVVPSYS